MMAGPGTVKDGKTTEDNPCDQLALIEPKENVPPINSTVTSGAFEGNTVSWSWSESNTDGGALALVAREQQLRGHGIMERRETNKLVSGLIDHVIDVNKKLLQKHLE